MGILLGPHKNQAIYATIPNIKEQEKNGKAFGPMFFWNLYVWIEAKVIAVLLRCFCLVIKCGGRGTGHSSKGFPVEAIIYGIIDYDRLANETSFGPFYGGGCKSRLGLLQLSWLKGHRFQIYYDYRGSMYHLEYSLLQKVSGTIPVWESISIAMW